MRRLLFLLLLFLLSPFDPAAARTVTDQGGRRLELEHPFARIISLYPAHTENLFSLDLDREIVGVGAGDDFPLAVQGKPRFSYREDPEKFLAARPDLVLIRPMIERAYPQLVEKLRRAGIAVVSLQPTTVAEMLAYWRTLGTLTGREEQAEAMVERFKSGLAALRGQSEAIPEAERKRVYFEAIHARMKTFAPDSMAVFALAAAGGINAAADAETVRETNIAFYGKERILARAAEIDVFLAQVGAMNRVDKEILAAEPGFQAIKAIREGQVFLIEEELVSRPTLRLLEGIRKLGALLYPERFGERTVNSDL